MKYLQATELTGIRFSNIDTILFYCSSVKIDDANLLFPNFENRSRRAYY